MSHRITGHVRRNAVAYLALAASVSAVGLKPGDGRPAGSVKPAVARFELAGHSSDDTTDTTDSDGSTDTTSSDNSTTSTAAPPASNIGARAHSRSIVAKHGGSTDIPLTGDSWTQSPQELNLVAGTMDIAIPAKCTGGFGNAMTLSVDGKATTFAAAPGPPASGTVTVPFLIGTLSEPGQNAQHKLSAKFNNACTKSGEDFTIKDVQIDVLKFH
jgi:hypothetical protein